MKPDAAGVPRLSGQQGRSTTWIIATRHAARND
jgi:hypothetical protein